MSDVQPEKPSTPTLLVGTEPLMSGGKPLGATLNDFWAWSSSDLLSNTLRGVLAEFIVGTALRCIGSTARVEWDACDLRLNDGARIEVKSTAYVQSWGESKPGSLSFSIKEATGWDAPTNTSGSAHARNSDVYVFCVLKAVDRVGALDVENWEFYVASTAALNSRFERQQSVRLSVLAAADGVRRCTHAELVEAVNDIATGKR